jgi:hypothetical protein
MCTNAIKFKEAAVNENGQIDGIGIQGSYFIRNQHVITTSQAKFNTKTHTKVNMSYTWTVCNLTLSNSNYANRKLGLLSETFFTNLGVAEFHLGLGLHMDDVRNGVSMTSVLAHKPINIKLPIRAQHTFELIDSNSPKHAVIARKSSSNQHINAMKGNANNIFEYTDLVNSMNQQQCVTFKYYVAYTAIIGSSITP